MTSKKINFIDNILWINLDRSNDRNIYMKDLLSNINIPNTRIKAIDGKEKNNLKNSINIEFERELPNNQISVTLSHIKAINYLNNIDGEYFMICEDDISFNNIKYFQEDLKTIILNSPEFDILMLYKTCIQEVNDLYCDWMEYYNKGIHFYGAVCYIISRKGIDNLVKLSKYIDDNNFIFNENIKFDFSEFFLFKNLKTYTYKYNYISTCTHESTIDSEQSFHLNSEKFQLEVILKDYTKDYL